MRLLALLLLLPGASFGWEPLPVEVRPVALAKRPGGPEQLGQLRYVAGLELRSPDRRFGGLSGLVRAPSGALLAVSDAGSLVRLREQRDSEGRLTGIASLEWLALHGPDGKPHARGLGDAEELQVLPDGRVLVAYEHTHRLVTIGPEGALDSHAELPFPTPKGIQNAPSNGGIEAVLAFGDGRVFAVREKPLDALGRHAAWLIASDGAVAEVPYLSTDGFQPTAMAALPGGAVLVLERRYRMLDGIAARLSRLSAPGGTAKALGTFGAGQICDNFEGLWVEGRRVLLVSDDNFNPTQHTYLLELELPAE